MARHDAGEIWTCDRCGRELTLPVGNPPPPTWRTVYLTRHGPSVKPAQELELARWDLCPDCHAAVSRILEVGPTNARIQALIIRAADEAIAIREGDSAYESLYRWVPDERRLNRPRS